MPQTLSLLPLDVTLRFARGLEATFEAHFEDVTGAAVDLAGDTVALVVRDAYGGAQQFTVTATNANPTTGVVVFSLTAANLTDGLSAGTTRWVYVITRTHGGAEIPWWGGVFEIHETAH